MESKKVLFHNKRRKEATPAKEKEWKEYAGAVRMFWEVYALDRQEYLKSLTEQIGTKRARIMVAEEVKAHIEDQKQDFMAHGLGEEEAESMAVVEMGDPDGDRREA